VSALTNISTNSVPGFIEDLTLVRVPPWWQSPWFIALVVALLAIAVFGGVRFYHRWRSRAASRPVVPASPAEPPHLAALERLAALRRRMDEMSPYDFTTECSLILRQYIGARFQIAIIFETTREFLVDAQKNPALSAEHRQKLGDYLHLCDRVKFGRGDMSRDQMRGLIDYGEAFVKVSA